MSTKFIAIQCFQCSTMQVKQQKKSSNKWTCVVCNEKQSVRKVYAQGFMARDIRGFVQTFNMSRKFADQQSYTESRDRISSERDRPTEKRRRSEWNEYIEIDETEEDHNLGEDVDDLNIVTEWPPESRKMQKNCSVELDNEAVRKPQTLMKNYPVESDTRGRKGTFGQSFSKGTSRGHYFSQEYEPSKKQPGPTEQASALSDRTSRTSNGMPRRGQPTISQAQSKWSSYMTLDKLAPGKDADDNADRTEHDPPKTALEDENFEEDVHPDFK